MLFFILFFNIMPLTYNDLHIFPSNELAETQIYDEVRTYSKPKSEFSFSLTNYYEFTPYKINFMFGADYLSIYNLNYTFLYDFSTYLHFKLAYLFFLTDRGTNTRNIALILGTGLQVLNTTYLYPSFGLRLSSRSDTQYKGVNFDIRYEKLNRDTYSSRVLFTLAFLFNI